MARKSGFVRRHNRMIRETTWIGIGPTSSALAAASAAELFSGFSTISLALRPFTIVRTRGGMMVQSDQTGASETFGCVLTAAVVTEQAIAAGINSVPTGDLDRDSDAFFLYEEVIGRFNFISGTGTEQRGVNQTKYFDSKAMRKVEDGFDVAMVVEAQAIVDGTNVRKFGRMLVKLH